METAYEAAMSAHRKAPEAQGMFISCPQWPVVGNVERLERDTEKPVVAQMGAVMWGCLSQVGVQEPRAGLGRLLREWPKWTEPAVEESRVGS
jgi:maleate cis-trans isomerase